jgi:hypothetical protein
MGCRGKASCIDWNISTHNGKKGRIACLHSKKAVGNNNRLITLLTWKGLGTARTKRSSHIFHWNPAFSLSLFRRRRKKKQLWIIPIGRWFFPTLMGRTRREERKEMGRSPPWSSSLDTRGNRGQMARLISLAAWFLSKKTAERRASPAQDLSCVCVIVGQQKLWLFFSPLVHPLSKLFLTGNYETCGEWWKFFQSLPNIMLSISGGFIPRRQWNDH